MDRFENQYLDEELPQPSAQNIVDEEELLAAQAAAEAAAAAQQQQPGSAFNNVGQGLTGHYRDLMLQYWQETINSIEHDEHDFKNHQLPLARIKKVMKTDEDVRMISAEAPILFAKGCDVFITELTMRAWIHAEEHKRRTLQKLDIAAALTKSDMFDFLIDVVPREEEKPKKAFATPTRAAYVGATQYKVQPPLPPAVGPQHHQAPQGSSNSDGTEQPDQFQQQQQQNLLQQHLLQQQIMHQQQQQMQKQQQGHLQQHHQISQPLIHTATPPPPQGGSISHPILQNGTPSQISHQTPGSQPDEARSQDEQTKLKVEEGEHMPTEGQNGNYTGCQNFNPVVYEEY